MFQSKISTPSPDPISVGYYWLGYGLMKRNIN